MTPATAKSCRPYPLSDLKKITTALIATGLLHLPLVISPASAQQADPKPSVMDRIQEKVRQRGAVANPNWFERLDPRGVGYVTKEAVESAIRQRFALLDTNRDGAIDRTEYSRQQVSPASPGLTFDMLDTDRNGKLSAAEFSAPITARFSRLDRDGDGRISRGEAAPYLAAPTARSLPPLSGTCFEIDGRLVTVAPERVETLRREGRRSADCAWKPGATLSR